MKISMLTIGLLCAGSALGAQVYVSPTGSDAGDGSEKQPFQTLEKARDAVRELKKTAAGDLCVRILPGRYVLDKTFVLGLEDGGSSDRKIIYEGDAKNPPVFVSDVPVTGWKKAADPIAHQSLKAKGKLWVADLPEGLGKINSLYDGDKPLPVSAFSFDSTEGLFGETRWRFELRQKLCYPEGALRAYENLEDIELSIYPRQRWMHHILRLKEVNESENFALPTRGVESGLCQSPQRTNAVTVLNTIDYLDEPGEWCVNTQTRKIYYWPKGGKPSSSINAPALTEYIRVEGEINLDSLTDVPVRNVHFRNLVLTKGERCFHKDADGATHSEWGLYDKDNGLLRFRGAEDCSVDNVTIRNSGAGGIRLDLHCQRVVVANCHIFNIGKTGIMVAGYGPGLKNVNHHNLIVNCEIHDVGQHHHNGNAVILTQTHDSVVRNCKIYNTPMNGISITGIRYWTFRDSSEYNGVRDQDLPEKLVHRIRIQGQSFDGKAEFVMDDTSRGRHERKENWFDYLDYIHTQDNRVEYCDISRTCQDLGDCNAIYIHTADIGNTAFHNYIHDIEGDHKSTALRSDNVQPHSVFSHNIVSDTYVQGGMNCSMNTQVLNNYFINCAGGDIRGHGYYILLHAGKWANTSLIERNICYDKIDPEFLFVRIPKYCDKQDYEVAKYAQIRANSNLFFSEMWDVETGAEKLSSAPGQGADSRYADPLFKDLETFKLSKKSPAHQMGIEPIDIEKIGLLSADYTVSNPWKK